MHSRAFAFLLLVVSPVLFHVGACSGSGQANPPQSGRTATSQAAEQPIQLRLLAELDSFRETEHFKFYGFARGGQHNGWLKRVQAARNQEGLDFETSVALAELEQLGLAYVFSDGEENDRTDWHRRRVHDPLGTDHE